MNTTKSTLTTMYTVLKNELKAKGLGYKDVADVLDVSVGSIRHRFADRTLTMEQIIAITELLGCTLSELTRKMETPPVSQFTLKQEQAFIEDLRLVLVLARIMDGWSIADIVATHELTEAQCIKYLLDLDRLDLIDLLPNNVVRPRIKRNPEWQPDGPLHRLMAANATHFLDSRFDGPFESRSMASGELTPAAIALLKNDLRQLQQRMEILHEECKIAPRDQRHRIVLLTAAREWGLPAFEALLRDKTKSSQKRNHTIK